VGRFAGDDQRKSARQQAGQATHPADIEKPPTVESVEKKIARLEKKLGRFPSFIINAEGRIGLTEKKLHDFASSGLPEIPWINEIPDIKKDHDYLAKLKDEQAALEKELEEQKAALAALKGKPKPKPKPKRKSTGRGKKKKKGTLQQSLTERRFQEQCFLIDNMDLLKGMYKDEKYNHFTVLNGENPQQFITKSTIPRGADRLHTATPAELSRLVPSIKLWKVHYPSETSTGEEIPFDFENHLLESSIEQMTKDKAGRGHGAGIKSLEWDLEGTNLYEADKLISARMTMIFQDMSVLTKVLRTTKDDYEIRYLDLFHSNKKYTNKDTWNEKHFRIKATVGWSTSKTEEGADEIYEAAKASGYTFFLSMHSHDITFNEDATIEVTIHYQATIESLLGDSRSDILLMDNNNELSRLMELRRDHKKEVSERKDENKKNKTRDKETLSPQAKKDEAKQNELLKKIETQKIAQYGKFLDKVDDNSRIYYIDIPNNDIGIWKNNRQESTESLVARRQRGGFSGGQSNSHGDWTKKLEDAIKTQKKSKLGKPKHRNSVRIHFMTLGGILDTALSVLGDNAFRLKELRTMVTDFDYLDPRTEHKERINLSQIPISLNLFQEWFYDECIKIERKSWMLKPFLKSLVDKMLLSAISEKCFPCVEPARTPRLNMIPVQLPLDSGKCLITQKSSVEPPDGPVNFEKISRFQDGDRRYDYNTEDIGNYLFFHLSSMAIRLVRPIKAKEERENIKNGIPSLYIGASRGLVKRISFQKEDNPLIKAARIREGMKGGGTQLGVMREIYNASVDMFGNNFFKPGTHVWIDAANSVFGASDGEESAGSILGLGGFYMILRVNSRIESGSYQTTLDCRWQSDGKQRTGEGRCKDGRKVPKEKEEAPAEPEASAPRQLSPKEEAAKKEVLAMFNGDVEAYNEWYKSNGDKSINNWSKALTALGSENATGTSSTSQIKSYDGDLKNTPFADVFKDASSSDKDFSYYGRWAEFIDADASTPERAIRNIDVRILKGVARKDTKSGDDARFLLDDLGIDYDYDY